MKMEETEETLNSRNVSDDYPICIPGFVETQFGPSLVDILPFEILKGRDGPPFIINDYKSRSE